MNEIYFAKPQLQHQRVRRRRRRLLPREAWAATVVAAAATLVLCILAWRLFA